MVERRQPGPEVEDDGMKAASDVRAEPPRDVMEGRGDAELPELEMGEPAEAPVGAAESAAFLEVDPIVKGAMVDLMKSISLRLWLVDMLLEGRIEEDHFNRLFDANMARLKLCMGRRNELLEQARDLEPIERALNESKVALAELEMKRAIGDISEGEYRAKLPALRWDIDKHEDEIAKKKREAVLLEDLTRVMSLGKIARMREMAGSCREALRAPARSLGKSCRISSETAAKVKASLKETLACLEDLRCI
ncbi:hypothetical protein AC482_06220 [miscellaneous Crenarchaeota group-15 archaeon DG-45]|uniref:CdvA-like coiled-coil domain-containing protein n=1 Tax=miscellaneous Crenarchaeota group-15 archaeon DG-45 TaxID=1685127 RepID=A0A0M0BMH3_9ARCH|nr:MAG: hypothetical protein AC482_06220 [miscellaneous Crenarchaeota group-15 archaeon DG-45]